jgi:CspA family cold shock protein
VQGDVSIELFFHSEHEADEKAESLRARGLTVQVNEFVGGRALAISGPATVVDELYREGLAERQSQGLRNLTGTVRWWRDDKGYGRISGDDGYVYFCHFSALEMEGYKSLRPGQRVEFERVEGAADHGRAGAANVRVIDET